MEGNVIKGFPTSTVEVIAITEPPAPGFMAKGRRVELGEKIRLLLVDASSLVRGGKASIVPGSERIERI